MKKWVLPLFKFLLISLFIITISIISFFYFPLPVAYLADKVGDQSDYYFENDERWIKDHSFLEIVYYKLWEFKIRRELVHNFYERVEEESQASVIRYTVNEIKYASITQHQGNFPVITGSGMSCLLRGFGYCDQVNSGLALVLQEKLEQVHLYNIYTDSNSHTLVKSHSELGTVWIDSYGCVNTFGFPDELTNEGKQTIQLYSGDRPFMFPEKSYREGVFFNAFTFSHSIAKVFTRFKNLFIAKTYNPAQVVVMERYANVEVPKRQARLVKAIQNENAEAKKYYLMGRVYHLSGMTAKAIASYQLVKEKSVEGLLVTYADCFIRRLEGKEVLCDEKNKEVTVD